MEAHEARESLNVVDAAPTLSRRPSAVEIAAGVLSVLVVLVGSAAVIIFGPPRIVGILAAAALLALIVAWITRRAPGRSSWQRIDQIARWIALIAVALPMQRLIWPTEDDVATGAWTASSIAALALGGFLATRWRR